MLSKLFTRALLRRTIQLTRNGKKSDVIQKRNAGDGYYGYREPNYRPNLKYSVYIANTMGGFMWWWVLYHCYYEPGHLFGEFEYYDPNAWKDSELGIPSDSEGLAPTIPNPRTTRVPGGALRTLNFSPHMWETHYKDTGAYKF